MLSFVFAGTACLCAEVFPFVAESEIGGLTNSNKFSKQLCREEFVGGVERYIEFSMPDIFEGADVSFRACEYCLPFEQPEASFFSATDVSILFLLYEFYTLAWGISVTANSYNDFALPSDWQIRSLLL